MTTPIKLGWYHRLCDAFWPFSIIWIIPVLIFTIMVGMVFLVAVFPYRWWQDRKTDKEFQR